MTANHRALTGTLDAIRDETAGEKISIGDLVDALNSRGYGPLLIGPSLITILPTGAIPGMPSLCALIIIFVSAQLLMGRSHPWLPARLSRISFGRAGFLHALEKARPYTRKIDRLIYPRFKFLIQDSFQPVIALLSIGLSIAIMILGFIPFMAILPASGILLLGLGLSARDGLLFALSFVVAAITLWLLPYGLGIFFK